MEARSSVQHWPLQHWVWLGPCSSNDGGSDPHVKLHLVPLKDVLHTQPLARGSSASRLPQQ